MSGPRLQSLLRAQTALINRLVSSISEEHARESESLPSSTAERRAERIERLLAGEPINTQGLEYDLEAHHVGLVVKGEDSPESLHRLARALDRRLLAMRHQEATVWVWLGGSRPIDLDEIDHATHRYLAGQVTAALGEPARGLAGWRLTHRQALAALPIALRIPGRITRYAEVALLASIVKNDLFAASLREFYLAPLARGRDGGRVVRETLRAYFAAACNASSAAARLGVNRDTINSRLRMIEAAIGRPLGSCAVEVEAALRLDEYQSLRDGTPR